MFQQHSSHIPLMNPSPAEIVELFSFVEVTLIQYATIAGHFPSANVSSVKAKPKKVNKVELPVDESKDEPQVNATAPTTPKPKAKAQASTKPKPENKPPDQKKEVRAMERQTQSL